MQQQQLFQTILALIQSQEQLLVAIGVLIMSKMTSPTTWPNIPQARLMSVVLTILVPPIRRQENNINLKMIHLSSSSLEAKSQALLVEIKQEHLVFQRSSLFKTRREGLQERRSLSSKSLIFQVKIKNNLLMKSRCLK